jgi:hypothetical protein
MMAICDKPHITEKQGCRDQATSFWSITTAMGCSAFMDSQKTACTCVPDSKKLASKDEL